MGVDDLDRLDLPDLAKRLLATPLVARLVDLALDEDLGRGDVTTELLVDPQRRGTFRIVAREAGVLAGIPIIESIMRKRAGASRFKVLRPDGTSFVRGDAVLEVEGPIRALLPLERTILNLLGRLSGVATRTARFVEAVAGTEAQVCDTRKTTPGLRLPEKYAVRCGGGSLHRIDLAEAMLVKDNHLAALDPDSFAERVAEAALAARRERSVRFVEVEVDSLEQFDRLLALPAGAIDMVLLDNMDEATLREAVARRAARNPELLLEASGGVRLESVAKIAATGVDRVSCGSLTKDAFAIDFGLDEAAP
jgi:nicotinate-nucleotide pyrophosphorylase (carboxylating)